MQQVVIVIHLMLVLALIGVVLLQRSEGGGLGIGGGSGFMTSRGTANVLTRATAILAGLFFATSLILSILAGMNRAPTSILGGSSRRRRPTRPPAARRRSAASKRRPAQPARRRAGDAGQTGCAGRTNRTAGAGIEITANARGRGTGPFRVMGLRAPVGLRPVFRMNMKRPKQPSAAIGIFLATHRRRAAARFSLSSNRFGVAKG